MYFVMLPNNYLPPAQDEEDDDRDIEEQEAWEDKNTLPLDTSTEFILRASAVR